MMLSGYYDDAQAVWRWGTGEILPSDSPLWDLGDPNGDPSPVTVMASVDGVHDATDGDNDHRAICEAGKYMHTVGIYQGR